MKERVTFQGRSCFFNVLFILMNLAGMTFLVMGFHEKFIAHSTLYITIAMILLITSIGGIIVFKGRLMMSSIARVVVGGLFIVSGLVKANDPLGFSYKLEEYFEDGALAFRIKEWFGVPGFSLEFLMDSALFLSVAICIVEIILGVLTIIGGKIKLVSYLLMGMMLFFTFLTWHTANCDGNMKFRDRDTYSMTTDREIALIKIEEAKTNKEIKIISKSADKLMVDEMKSPQCVSDCGCFGDALKGSVGRSMTPKESLWKDLVLLYFIIWIFAAQWKIQANTRRQNMVFLVASLTIIMFFSWVFSWYFPLLFGFVAIIGALWILRAGGKLLGNHYGSMLIVGILSFIVTSYVLAYIPLMDYRPYAAGSDLKRKMNDGVPGEFISILVYKNKKTGKSREYSTTSKDYQLSKIWENPDWEYLKMTQKEIRPTILASIDSSQFNPFIKLSDLSSYERELKFIQQKLVSLNVRMVELKEIASGNRSSILFKDFNQLDYPKGEFELVREFEEMNPDVSEISIQELILTAPKIVMVSSRSLNDGNWKSIEKIKAIKNYCDRKKIPFVVITSANHRQIESFRKKHHFNAAFFINDETELKAICRSNPAILVFERGIVKAKYPHRSIPDPEEI